MSTPESAEKPVYVEGQSHLESLVSDNDVVVVDYYADWCGPCKMLEPTLEELAAETDAVVAKLDIDEHQQLAQSAGVRSVPTLEFYANGEAAERVVGVQEKSALESMVSQLSS
ncbi:thioredoxin [Haloprofundus marisrubri]|uniref:Thioredoxin n=1 Tax=Haloprofundus marisrubri TaxID=1514971 RepID=A0A0W1RAA0_9EURY|nr:thioredoxin [Haloprofundus marisrubri]KTG10376.1 thioredoxin [Haloprofundus marisrubri]